MRKIKITVFCGSANQGGRCEKTVNQLLENIRITYEVELDYFKTAEIQIKPCLGCEKCFNGSTCPLDQHDSMEKIKESMMKSDLFILATPIYAKQVSGTCKLFIDRLSYWMHLMKMRNKPSIVIISTSSSGIREVNTYLTDILTWLGFYNLFSIQVKSNTSEKQIKTQINLGIANLLMYLNNEKNLWYSDLHRIFFNTLSSGIKYNRGSISERKYWESQIKDIEIINYVEWIKKM